MSCHRTFPVIASVFSILLAAGSARADLIVNGGFETGDFTGWEIWMAPLGSMFGLSNDANLAHTGNYSFYFAGLGGEPDAIYQIVPTVAGQQYRLTFWLNYDSTFGERFRVSWEGTTVLELTPVEMTNGWKEYTLQLTATASGSELRFAGNDFRSYIRLDDVSLVEVAAVPSPASAALGVIGAGFVLLRRRR